MLLREPEDEPKYQEKAGEGRSRQLCWRHLKGPAPPQVHFSFPLVTSCVWCLRFSHVTGPSTTPHFAPAMDTDPSGATFHLQGFECGELDLGVWSSHAKTRRSQGGRKWAEELSVDRSKEEVGRGRVQREQGPGWSCPPPDSPVPSSWVCSSPASFSSCKQRALTKMEI